MDPKVSAQAVALYVAIETHCDRDGMAWPGQARLASYYAVSVRTVRAWLRELVAAGWVVVHVEYHEKGRQNIYEVMWDARPPSGRAEDIELPDEGGSGSSLPHGVRKHTSGEVVPGGGDRAPRGGTPQQASTGQEVDGRDAESSSATSRARGAQPVDNDVDDDDSDTSAPPPVPPDEPSETALLASELADRAIDIIDPDRTTQGPATPGEANYIRQALERNPDHEHIITHDLIRRAQLAAAARQPRAYLAHALIDLSMIDLSY